MEDPFKEKFSLIPDIPISEIKEDRLGHRIYVNQLISIVSGCNPQYPFNIGLFGKWGSGKTGVINLFRKRIEEDAQLKKQMGFAYIDAWKFSRESLRQEILIELNDKFGRYDANEIQERLFYIHETEIERTKNESFIENLKKNSTTILFYFFFLLVLLIIGGLIKLCYNIDIIGSLTLAILIPLFIQMFNKISSAASAVRMSSRKIIPQASSPQEFDKLFRDIVSQKKTDKLVITIDNLDRCDSGVAVEMLGTIKSMMDISGCVYIVACDDEALERHLTKTKGFEKGDAKEFLRKFFQTSITIPTLIDEELSEYIDNVADQSDIKIPSPVKEVIMAATTRNPRRVKQLLNTLMPTYRMCLSREYEGKLKKGLITSNIGFLAKIMVLKEEWPDFSKELENNTDLLSNFEQYFMGRLDNPPDIDVPLELTQFLRATRTITTEDIEPYLKLTQESYESTIPELSVFRNRLLRADIDYVRATLQKKQPEEREAYIKETLKIIKNLSIQDKSIQLFNCLSVLIEILPIIPESLNYEVINSLEINIFNKKIRSDIRKLNARSIFKLMPSMTENSKRRLLERYSNILLIEKKFDNELFDIFLDNLNSLDHYGIVLLNNALISLLKADEATFMSVVGKVTADPQLIVDIIEEGLISEIIAKINATITWKDILPKIDLYMKMKMKASDRNKKQFIELLIRIMVDRATNTFGPNTEKALEILMKLKAEDIPEDSKDLWLPAMTKFADSMINYNHKVAIYKFVLKHHKMLEKKDLEKFCLEHIAKVLDSGIPASVKELIKAAQEYEVKILNFSSVVTSLANRIKKNMPDQALMEYMIEGTPTESKNEATNLIVELINTGNPSFFEPALKATRNKSKSLTKEHLDKVSDASVKAIRKLGIPKSVPFLDFVVEMLPNTSEIISKVFTDQLVEFTKSNDPNTRKVSLDYYRKIQNVISDERRTEIIHEIISKLHAVSDRIDQYQDLVTLIIEEQEFIEDQYREMFIDILLPQLSTAKTENSQIMGIKNLMSIRRFGIRENRVIEKILDLAKVSTPQVRDLCKQSLSSTKRYKTRAEFRKQVDELK